MTNRLLNYTTKVPDAQSAGEIMGLLSAAGAERITLIYEKGTRRLAGVEFSIDSHLGMLHYKLPVEVERLTPLVEEAFRSAKKKLPDDDSHSRDVGWRILKDWTEAQVALIQIGLVKFEQVMMPYMLLDDGRTAFDAFEAQQLSLGPGAKK